VFACRRNYSSAPFPSAQHHSFFIPLRQPIFIRLLLRYNISLSTPSICSCIPRTLVSYHSYPTMPPDLHTLPLSRSPTASPNHPRVLSSVTEPYRRQTPSPRSSSFSLAAAATINAGNQAQNEESRRSSTTPYMNRVSPITSRSERRRSYVGLTLEMNDPTTPSPGEMQSPQRRESASFMSQQHRMSSSAGDPYHQRNPSLGELHQELEQEQEAQVVSKVTRG
jgi:hypothetical protein